MNLIIIIIFVFRLLYRNIMYTTYFPSIVMDLVSNQVYVSNLRGTRNVTTSPDWQIPLGVWTHLTMQVWMSQSMYCAYYEKNFLTNSIWVTCLIYITGYCLLILDVLRSICIAEGVRNSHIYQRDPVPTSNYCTVVEPLDQQEAQVSSAVWHHAQKETSIL